MQNRVIFEGTVAREPNLRYTKKGSPVCNFSIKSTNDRGYDTYMSVVVWGSQAEDVSKNLRLNMLTEVEGSLSSRSWVDKQENKRTSIDINAQKVRVPTEMSSFPDNPPPPHSQDEPPF